MKCLLVLSHLMDKNAVLEKESADRAELAISLFKNYNFNFLITSGWAYRNDSSISICDAFRDYIVKNSEIKFNQLITLPLSRDTVGDAFFSLRLAKEKKIKKLFIVTSDYHVERTRKIFESFFLKTSEIKIFGIDTKFKDDFGILRKEAQSIKAFKNSFNSTNFFDLRSITRSLTTNHPFYNGQIYPKLKI